MSDGYKFKKRGNEEQHKHNVKVLSKIQEANESIKEQTIEEAQLKIAEGIGLQDNINKTAESFRSRLWPGRSRFRPRREFGQFVM